MRELLKTTNFLFDKIKKLYPTFERPDELDIEVWGDILEGYSQTQILEALKSYRKNVEYNKAPNPAEFKKHLPEKAKKHLSGDYIPMTDPAVAYMQRDIKLGRCRHLLPVYQAAVRYIAEDILAQEIPVTEWRRMSFAERCEAAMKRGLFNRFDEVLVLISRRDNGKDYQFESGSQIVRRYDVKSAIKQGISQVAAHFRTDDAEMAKTAGF